MSRLGFFTRFRRLGLLSLCTLFAGGAILVFVGVNVSGAPTRHPERIPPRGGAEQRPFRYGYSLSVQAWLAIVGIGFGLISHGLNEAYLHFFDWWCSRQARKDAGLDYARYLNSQPRAPVVYGIRGFPVWVSMRYLLAVASIAASIGYKFGIVEVPIQAIKSLNNFSFWVNEPPLKAVDFGDFSPWITDGPSKDSGQAFLHETSGYDETEPPTEIFAVGLADPNLYGLDATGFIYSREIIMVAKLSEEPGPFVMVRDDASPLQTETSNVEWFGTDLTAPAVVEYRIVDPGKVQIQWAKADDDPDEDGRQSVAHRLTYTMRFAVAEVRRGLSGSKPPVHEVLILSSDEKPVATTGGGESWLNSTQHWVEAALRDSGTTAEDGVSIIVRAAMAGWLSEDPRFELVWDFEKPFGPEDTSDSHLAYVRERLKIQMEYPYYVAIHSSGSGVTGCYHAAAVVFITLGCIAIAVGSVRIFLGPPTLTSWMGQHVYLVSAGAATVGGNFGMLATGYEVAGEGVGRVNLDKDLADGDGGTGG
ncbi:hypothetical protein ACJ41O_001124 [Fusarium nematophilum]